MAHIRDADVRKRKTLNSQCINHIEICENHNPNVATILNNLAELYRAQGRYDDAELLHRQALAIREKALGAEHPDVATSLATLAALLEITSRADEATALKVRVAAIWAKRGAQAARRAEL